MFAAAFLDVQPELMTGIREAVQMMELGSHVEFDASVHSDGILNGTRFLVRDENSKALPHTSWKDLRKRFLEAGLEERIRENALGIFEMLAGSEAVPGR